ncbi:RNA polymerase sigma factor [Rhizorhabdus argentea]|uniref:RNA polymerase sigma factor n=1 Tax=Rhizorhabdus argentea TaxID=1387174 RepID=UPI0030EDF27C
MFSDDELNGWFRREVLALEPSLTTFLRRHCSQGDEVADLRQEVYEKALRGASRSLPNQTAAYIFAIARNLLITRAKRARIIRFEFVADLEALPLHADVLTPERYVSASQELARARAGLEGLPPRCREVMRLRKVQGMKVREIAEHLGIGIDAVEQQITRGIRLLANHMLQAAAPFESECAAIPVGKPRKGS